MRAQWAVPVIVSILILGVLGFTQGVSAADSDVVIDFVAIVETVDDLDNLLDGMIQPGDTITGTYVYNLNTVDTNNDVTVGQYYHYTSPYGITLTSNSFVFQTDPADVEFLVELVNRSDRDNYLLRSYNNLPLSNGIPVSHIAWQLDDTTATALSDVSLPSEAPNLADWDSAFGLTIDGDTRDELSPGGFYFIRAHVTSVELVVPDINGKIVFTSNRDGNDEIYVMNPDGSGQTRLTDNLARDWCPSWSPDGTKIVFVSDRDGNDEIYVMNADGSDQTRLTNNPADDWCPSWSPDGTKIVFVSDRDGNDDIYVMNADGSGQTRLTSFQDDDKYPVWSPDGTKIAYQSFRNGNTDIWVMNPDGSGQTSLTQDPARDEHPDWSPDGTKIAFDTGRVPNSKSAIYVMNADGSGQTGLGNQEQDVFPSWSPDGTRITFATFRDFNTEIYVMNADGSGQTRLTNILAADESPDWQALEVSSQPNLVVSSMTHSPASPDTNDLMTFTATVTNQGGAPASATTLMFKIGGETPGGSDTLFKIPALAPGASSIPVERVLTLDVAQNYRNTATADYFSVVGESNEADNTLTDDFTVTESDCLIATAAYGSHLAPQVQELRELRDNVVLKTESGKAFMDYFNKYYYTFAPTVAKWENENSIFKEAVKVTITPLLSSLSLLNYVDIDSEAEMLGYGIGTILLNIGMYFVAPAILIVKLRDRFSR